MANTLVVSGLAEVEDETAEQALGSFQELCAKYLDLPDISGDVLTVYRVGSRIQKKVRGRMVDLLRILIVQCAPKLRIQILRNKKALAKIPLQNGL